MVNLNAANLTSINPSVSIPAYDRGNVTPGIVHFGVGAFHRSHEAMYIDRLLNSGQLNSGQHLEWGICGVGVLPSDAQIRDALAHQDNLYTLVVKHPDGQSEARVIGSIVEYLFAPDDPEAVIEKLAAPTTKIVSLTVTEGGYSVNDATGEFDASGPDIVHDLGEGAVPRTVFGFLTEGLRRRRERAVPPFTVMSCDNMQGNGHVTKRALTSFARLKDPGLSAWIAEHVAFPNSMVDRITPVTTDQNRRDLLTEQGVADAWPVVSESFTQWVLEDHFTLGRPPLEAVSVQLVRDVEPYELMKLRLLNAGHQAMSYLGMLAGYTYVHEVCQQPLFTAFLLDYMTSEAIPTLKPVPGIDLGAYCQELLARFASPAIQDTLARLAVDASERIPKFLLPVVRDQLAAGGEIERSALVVASWSVYLEAADHDGHAVALQDKRAPLLMGAVRREADRPGAFLEVEEVFGTLATNERFKSTYLAARENLKRLGPVRALQALQEEKRLVINREG